ncbi:right-handed parallel beta-helix repeat-containing protein [Cytophagaceae bacterium ABcell3]|nr:right-handed parallel beta-helix repeat-containing protein [Cytophagaceae bacterium ABcell3]
MIRKKSAFQTSLSVLALAFAVTFSQCKKKEDEINPQGSQRVSVDDEPDMSMADVDYVISKGETVVDNDELDLPAGSVIVIESGTRGPLLIRNFNGNDGGKYKFVNAGGAVEFQVPKSNAYSIKVENSTFFSISGNGGADEYGIRVNGGNNGLQIDDLSSNFTVNNLEIYNCGFAGIMAKTDPRCDGSANRGEFTMKDVHLFNNYIHDVEGEGFYIGNSFYAGWTGNNNCSGSELFPHDIHGLRLHDNIVQNTGWDGIQVGCASMDTEIYNNVVDNYGYKGEPVHSNGIQLGEGTTGKCYNNTIRNGRGNGIILLGLGDNQVYNNLIVNPEERGAFADSRYTNQGSDFAFYNNTIVNPGSEGILIYSTVTNNQAYNNIIVGTDKYVEFGNGAEGEEKNNFESENIEDAQFVNAASGDFRLDENSPCINGGVNLSYFRYDLDENMRPNGTSFDIGAFEH